MRTIELSLSLSLSLSLLLFNVILDLVFYSIRFDRLLSSTAFVFSTLRSRSVDTKRRGI